MATIALFFLALSSAAAAAAAACNKHDHRALLAFKDSFPHNSFPSWNSSARCCSWDYVTCTAGRVTNLYFAGNSLTPPPIDLNGSIPASIGDFPRLESIYLGGMRSLAGPVPPEIAKLKRLQSLVITDTSVAGPVPPFLSELRALRQLTLASSMFAGSIPRSLGRLANLTSVYLQQNRLTGSIPGSLFSRTPNGSLAELDLSGNKLTGSVPKSFAGVGFATVRLSENGLVGDASFLFGRSKPLQLIMLQRNKLAFDLSGVEYPSDLTYVDVSHNRIYGSISEQILEGPVLHYLDVSYNELCGKIPSGGFFSTFIPGDYSHNKCLCGAPLSPCKSTGSL
ncbi:polygalacturonase inhibitor-like [Iris pallida]|uniref:Polygalacturonase inhibitor-like n=1 Tax=Iris pallida TaxID=29817 RepID=A0AAX6EJB4_IRIPA|nr:polygalacturonase inhibitor-like [Iris pallida]